MTFEQLSAGMRVVMQCPCGLCRPEWWEVVRKGVGRVVFESLGRKTPGLPRLELRRRADGGLLDSSGAAVKVWARGRWG